MDVDEELAQELSSKAIIDKLTTDELHVLEDLKQHQEKHNVLEKDYQAEVTALKKKYRALFEPLYKQRANALARNIRSEQGCGIDNFWMTAMKNHRMLFDMIEPVDEPVLAYLQDIRTVWLEASHESEKSGFELRFQFAENPYFEPLELVKSYYMETTADEKEPLLASTDCSVVQWKAGRDITKKTVTRKQKNKRTKQIRKLTETVSVQSFFNFFTKHEIPSEEEMDNMNEEQVEELEVVIEADYAAGVIIRDKIIPNAVDWFTGDAVDSDMDMESDDMEDDDQDDDMENDEEDEDEEEDDDMKKNHKKGKRSQKKDETQCKQQ